MKNTKEIKILLPSFLENAGLAVLMLLLILFPLVFTIRTTDPFILPKQALVLAVSFLILLFFGIKTTLVNRVRIRKTPFDIAIIVFTIVVFISSLLAINKAESLVTFVPFFFLALLYFAITNYARSEKTTLLLVGSLLIGGLLDALIYVLSYFKIYILPMAFTQVKGFTPLGSILDQSIYLFLTLTLALTIFLPLLKKLTTKEEADKKNLPQIILFGVSSIVLLIGFALSLYQIIRPQGGQGLILLPLETGFQIGFAAISQDAGRIFQGFLFGSGFGTFLSDFTRFKQATINLSPTLWSITFLRSSSFILELLATTGILGVLSFVYLVYKILKERPIFVPLVLAIAASIVLPFSYSIIFLFFVLIAIFAAIQGLHHQSRFYDVELQLVAFKKGILSFNKEETTIPQEGAAKFLPYFILGAILLFVVLIGFISGRYFLSNIVFQESLVAASQNNGNLTYQKESQAISLFPYSDVYYRIFSQANLALANSLYSSIPQGTQPNAQTTQTIYTLIQQAINSGRQATTLSPLNATDWQNLATIYRNLIGLGQNADSFALLAAQQAVYLDPNNPQEYINLGGLYYQLSQWDKAQEQFQKAASLKPDYPNAYYNLGHTLQQKGDLKGALAQYQTVKSLVANDKTNLEKINGEIAALQQGVANNENPAVATPTPTPKPPIPTVTIPGPSNVITPTPTAKATPTPTAKP